MDWNDIRYVLSVAEQGTLQAAAAELGVNHTTVWRRIQALEKSMGTQLFITNRNGYRLTDAGSEVLAHAKAMSANVDAIDRIMSGQTKELSGLLRVTAPFSMANQIIPSLVKEFQDQYPTIRFEILSKNSALDLERREADIAFRATNDVPDNLIGRELGFSKWSLYISPNLYDGGALSLDEIAQFPIIGYREFTAPSGLWFEKTFKHISKAVTCTAIETAATCARLGMGVALLPQVSVEGLTEIYTLPNKFGASIWLLTHRELRSSARLKAFWDFVVAKNEAQTLFDLSPPLFR